MLREKITAQFEKTKELLAAMQDLIKAKALKHISRKTYQSIIDIIIFSAEIGAYWTAIHYLSLCSEISNIRLITNTFLEQSMIFVLLKSMLFMSALYVSNVITKIKNAFANTYLMASTTLSTATLVLAAYTIHNLTTFLHLFYLSVFAAFALGMHTLKEYASKKLKQEIAKMHSNREGTFPDFSPNDQKQILSNIKFYLLCGADIGNLSGNDKLSLFVLFFTKHKEDFKDFFAELKRLVHSFTDSSRLTLENARAMISSDSPSQQLLAGLRLGRVAAQAMSVARDHQSIATTARQLITTENPILEEFLSFLAENTDTRNINTIMDNALEHVKTSDDYQTLIALGLLRSYNLSDVKEILLDTTLQDYVINKILAEITIYLTENAATERANTAPAVLLAAPASVLAAAPEEVLVDPAAIGEIRRRRGSDVK